MKEFEKLRLLLNLPYKTISIFDGEKMIQKTVVEYEEITKQINLNRKQLLDK